jgi:hypothetical protein
MSWARAHLILKLVSHIAHLLCEILTDALSNEDSLCHCITLVFIQRKRHGPAKTNAGSKINSEDRYSFGDMGY